MSNARPQILIYAIATSAMLAAASALAGEPVRTVQDASRDRVWVLESDALYLHEGAQKRRFELPGWVYVTDAYACAPAVALDAQGAAVVTSNVVPVLWRIDPAKAQVTSHELTLDADADKDVGFSGLAYAPEQGVFYAVSATYGSLWRIDPLLRRAQKIPVSTPLRDACGLTVDRSKVRRTVVLCAQGRLVHLAPDQRAGYVFAGRCAQDSSL
jgi:streptogramin lyase